jgi:hypothetical protein
MNKNDKDVGTGLVGAPACGDVMKLQVILILLIPSFYKLVKKNVGILFMSMILWNTALYLRWIFLP